MSDKAQDQEAVYVWQFAATLSGLTEAGAIVAQAGRFDSDTLTGLSVCLPVFAGHEAYISFVIDKASPKASECLDFCESIKLARSPLTLETMLGQAMSRGDSFAAGIGVARLLAIAHASLSAAYAHTGTAN